VEPRITEELCDLSEFDVLWLLAHDPDYQLPRGVRRAELARALNREFHGGRPARTVKAISSALSRLRKERGRV